MRPVYALVEGQSEEQFVKTVLNAHFKVLGLFIVPHAVVTKKTKTGTTFSGGVTSFGKFKNDMDRLLGEAGRSPVTTMLDYYRLPADFPGMNTRPNLKAIDRVLHIESEIHQYFGSPRNFLPYLSMHEFEALLFSSPDELPRALTQLENTTKFAQIRSGFSTPEEINERPDLAPSKRIKAMFPGYGKALHGPMVSKRIEIERLRAECPHFNYWVSALEKFARRS